MFDHVVMVADEASLLETMDKIRPDLVVVDLSFPITQESNVVRRLKTYAPAVRVLVLSVHDDRTVVARCLSAGAAGVVLKRSLATDLVPAVTGVLQGQTYVSPSLTAITSVRTPPG
jgi:DNA-binding NarL/FixJ family response regulator